jgi:hypothetical protein
MAETRYPGSDVRVLFPIEPEAFFAGDSGSAAELLELEMPPSAVG